MAFKSLVMRKCNFVILLETKEDEDGAWCLHDLKHALHTPCDVNILLVASGDNRHYIV
jgi:hypothetical protein